MWNEGKISLIPPFKIRDVSAYLECSSEVAWNYLNMLYLLVTHLVERKPITFLSASKNNQTLVKLLILANFLIKGEIQLNNHASRQQYLFLRDVQKLLNFSSERNAWDYYKTLLELTWMIVEKFKAKDPNKFMDYFSSAS